MSFCSSRTSQSRTTELQVPVSVALADSVLLCVLQEPLQDPSVAHIEALLSRLEVRRFHQSCGAPQGSVLGLLPFNVFMVLQN